MDRALVQGVRLIQVLLNLIHETSASMEGLTLTLFPNPAWNGFLFVGNKL